ncbi:GCN5 family acetyltransferase [Duganella sp. Leaf126]|uniref:GNAT family N-acetyltransferase n=1 Tax=Duganella sp. Leaf126 TaxID=1736266 RepID=UPI0006F5792E|nr:GNAT family N-acetyltransferase [Duganella sp. Leaf126]KQQ33590.1 GCN5 family acetyltransferase [Duganella sp. Leaf126]
MIILDTARLRLRTITTDDAQFYHDLVNDPTWLEFIGDKGIRSIAQARTAITEGPMAMQHRHGFSLYVMERKADGRALGMCGLIRRDFLPDADIGYAIRPEHFGRGYTLEAARAVLELARGPLGMTRVLGLTAPGNVKSISLLHKLGMHFEGVQVLPPGERVTNVYAVDFPS